MTKKTYKNIKLMADYQCWPLWDIDDPDNINPSELPISEELNSRLEKWAEWFTSGLDMEDGASSGFSSVEEQKKFIKEGEVIFHKLKEELPDINFTALL